MIASDHTLDCLIIGAGPAGLQAADMLNRKGLAVRVLERGAGVGAFFRRYPRHRQLISINKVHTGLSNPDTRLRYDWNSLLNDDGLLFTDYSPRYFPPADDYVAYLEAFAARLEDVIETACEVTRISRDDLGFTVACTDGRSFRARQVIVATGVSLPWMPEFEGVEHVEPYTEFDTDPARYEDKRVLILGKGNSAFETADSLIETTQSIHVLSPEPVKFAWNSHFVGHLRAVNNNFLDTYQLKSQNAVIDAEISKIEKDGDTYVVTAKMKAAEGHEIVLRYDHVIACTGFRFDASIFDDAIRPEMRHFGKFPAMTSQWESETIEGLWFAGTIMQCRDFKKTMSGFVHGFRHNVACLAEFVAMRANGTAYPTDRVSPDDLAASVIDRISTASGIFLQPGFLADVIAGDGTRYRDVPLHWAQESLLDKGEAVTVTLEYGDFGANPLHVKRQHTAFGGEPDPFIHPVLRHWKDGEVVAQMHLSDHLDADWRALEDRDTGSGTVMAMTYADQGRTRPPYEVAREQVAAFLTAQGFGNRAVETAAE